MGNITDIPPPPYSVGKLESKEKAYIPSDSEYHLQINDYTQAHLVEAAGRRRAYAAKVNSCLDDLFTSRYADTGQGVPDDYICPFEYSRHVVETISQESGGTKRILKLAFKVSSDVDKTFQEVSAEFCERVFSKDGQNVIVALTRAKLFGLSPVRETLFAQIWNSCFFLRTIVKGGQNLRTLLESHSALSQIPDWLTTSCFAFSANASFNCGTWAARTLTQHVSVETIQQLTLVPHAMTAARLTAAGIVVVEAARAFLMIRASRKAVANADAKFNGLGWKVKLQRFVSGVDSVLRLIQQQHLQSVVTATEHMELGDLLLNIMDLSSDIFTTNQHAFKIYDELREKSGENLQKGLGFAAAHLGASGVFAALSTVTITTVTVAPMAIAEMSTLTALAVSLGFVEAPLVYSVSSAALFTPAAPIALAALAASVIWAAVSIDSLLDKRKAQKRIDCFVKVNNLVVECWSLADDTYALLAYIRCTDRAQPVFTSIESRDAWAAWIERVRSKSNALPTTEDYSGQGLRNYLQERARDIISWKVEMTKLLDKFD